MQIRAIHPSLNNEAVDTSSTSLKRSASDDMNDDIADLLPPAYKSFGFDSDDVSCETRNSLFIPADLIPRTSKIPITNRVEPVTISSF